MAEVERIVGYNSLTITRNDREASLRECRGLKEIRDIHTSLFRLIRSSHHMSGDYIFEALTDNAAAYKMQLQFQQRHKNTGVAQAMGDSCNGRLCYGLSLLVASVETAAMMIFDDVSGVSYGHDRELMRLLAE